MCLQGEYPHFPAQVTAAQPKRLQFRMPTRNSFHPQLSPIAVEGSVSSDSAEVCLHLGSSFSTRAARGVKFRDSVAFPVDFLRLFSRRFISIAKSGPLSISRFCIVVSI